MKTLLFLDDWFLDARVDVVRHLVRPQLAREIIRAKIHNQRVMLMRNGEVPDRVLSLLAGFRDAAERAADPNELLGIEGTAAALYFEQFESMLKQRDDWKFDWRGRNRRPPRDPVNALLSLGYSMLAKELTGVCHAVGLDPVINHDEDQVLFVSLGPAAGDATLIIEAMGLPYQVRTRVTIV